MNDSKTMRGLEGSFVLHGDGQTPPLCGGAVVLDGSERVIAVGPAAELRVRFAEAAWETHAAVLMPGLVNAHTHLELSALRGQVPGGRGFAPWVDALVNARARLRPEEDLEAIDEAVSSLLSLGVVAVGEVANSLNTAAAIACRPLFARVFHEVFGVREETAQVMLEMARQRRRELSAWPPSVRYALAPHTTYTLHPRIFREILQEVRASGERTSVHLAEHAAERAFLETGQGPFAEWMVARGASALDWELPGCDAVSYAQSLGALGPDVIAVHLCDARREELARVAAEKSPIVLCPRSNLFIELKLPPLLDMLSLGLRPGLGTDSLASNTSLDPLEEASALAQRFPSVEPRVLLAMATGFGADALGFSGVLGRLHEGLFPGVLAFEHGTRVPEDPERFVLRESRPTRRVLSRPAYHRLPLEAAA